MYVYIIHITTYYILLINYKFPFVFYKSVIITQFDILNSQFNILSRERFSKININYKNNIVVIKTCTNFLFLTHNLMIYF